MLPIIILFGLGLIFGSFINALVWRTRQNELKKNRKLSILKGRSQCPDCHHELAARDLVPLLSWLMLRGHCRYCGQPISRQYPLVELATSLVFVSSYIFWPGGVFGAGDWLLLVTWLGSSVGLIALLIYDLRWMLLPNHILYPTLAVSAAGRLIYILAFSANIAHSLLLLALSLLVSSGFFWLIYMASSGRLIGFGDVRLGLILGTLLAKPELAFLMIFSASVLGSLIALPALITKQRKLTSRIPFGPYLVVATAIVLLFGQSFIDWYNNNFLH